MRTWVLWTHYDCEVYVTLHPSEWDAWVHLMDNWLNDCDENCGHEPDTYTAGSEVREAIEWHFEDLSYDIQNQGVPDPLTAEQILKNAQQLLPQTSQKTSERNTMPADQADNLLSSLQAFKEGS